MDEKKPEGIPSPLAAMFGFGKPPIVKTLNMTVQRPRGGKGFLDKLSTLMLIIVGMAAAYAFTMYTPLSIEDWVGTIAFACWNLACVLAIVEHSRRSEVENINQEDQDIIKKAIEQFNKI